MAKAKTIYTCTECGASEPKWQGQCPSCMAWNTLVESIEENNTSTNRYANKFEGLTQSSTLQKISSIKAADIARQPTGNSEFDRVLGGGLVEGGVVLIGGDPGIGKSTLLLQVLCHLGDVYKRQKDRCVATFSDMKDIETKKEAFTAIITQWIKQIA